MNEDQSDEISDNDTMGGPICAEPQAASELAVSKTAGPVGSLGVGGGSNPVPGLSVADGSANRVTNDELRISREVRTENGKAEERLCAKCRWEHMTRTHVIREWGDPRTWK